jgi:hypothetical protein
VQLAETVLDRPDHEDNPILECTAASGSMPIVATTPTYWRCPHREAPPVVTSTDFVKRTDAVRRARRR